jgi:peptide/nickel transport system ATP-binding protein
VGGRRPERAGTPRLDCPVLSLDHVSIAYGDGERTSEAVHEVSLTLQAGEILALVGESGSGKTSIANAILGLLPRGGKVTQGRIEILGQDIVGRPEKYLRHIRGQVIGLVPQDPMVSLNPTMRIGQQVGETVRLRGVPRPSIPAEVYWYLERAGLDEPAVRARQYPHELSGGIRQRALIANALAGKPKVIVADEPTSALDVTVQRRMLDHLEQLVHEEQIALILITHDLAIASDRADRVTVMSKGRIVEEGPSRNVLTQPRNPYTKQLLAAAPVFSVRSPATAVANRGQGEPAAADAGVPVPAAATSPQTPVLALDQVVKEFHRRSAPRASRALRVLDGVSLSVPPRETLAVVGESGRGKTTLVRIAMGLQQPTSGRVYFDGTDITDLSWRRLRPLRRRFQFVHQDPYSSLDPRLTIEQSVVEPLVSHGIGNRKARHARALELLEEVALPRTCLSRRPRELSGGQRQRVAIARALSIRPDLIMLDEPVSALDVSVQAQILGLLADLQRELGIAYLLVTHDLAVVAQVAQQVAVLGAGGTVVESGPTRNVFRDPRAEETRQLLDAIPGRRLTTEPRQEGARQ